MPSPVDRRTRRIAVVIFIVGSVFIVGSHLLEKRGTSATILQNAPRLVTSLFGSIVSFSFLAFGLAMGVLTFRFRKDRALNWVAATFGVFLLLEMLARELGTPRFVRLHPWTIGVLEVLTSIAALQTVLGLPSAIRRIETTIAEAARRRESQLRLSAAAESSTDAILMMDAIRTSSGEITDFRFIFLNRKAADLFGRDHEELIGLPVYENFPDVRDTGRKELYRQVIETGESRTFEMTHPVFKHNGENAHLYVQVVKLDDGIVITMTDVTDWRKANEDLKKALSFSKAMVDCSPFCTIVTDTTGIVTSINPAGEQMLGYKAGELLGKNVTVLHDSEEIERRAKELSLELETEIGNDHEVFRVVTETGKTDCREWTYVRRDGTRFPVQLSVTAVIDHTGRAIGFMGTSYDLTDRKKAEEYIYHVAHHDMLTGLPTRTLLCDRLDVALERARRYGETLGLIMVDLDHFKRVNDSLGHPAGDTLLCEVAKRLKECVRKSDTVARMGGDEFVVLLTDMHGGDDAEQVAHKLQDAISQPIHLGGRHNITVTASIGVSIFPVSADADMLFKNADLAMYRAKARGRNGIEMYSPGLGKESLQKLQMESALRDAIKANELEIVYQPQISLADNRMIGVEALLRWHSVEFGNVMPSLFIPIAEETGLIVPISEWVLRTACEQIAGLQREIGKEISLAVNISPRQFQQKNFPTTIELALQDSGLRAEQLELEITEQLLMMDSDESLEIMKRVRTLGVRFAIDDFGTGFSNMGYITRFAVDRIKIDRSFITKCDCDSNSQAVTAAIIALAHSLDIEVIAEGVETTPHVRMLTTMKCDQAQGYLYSRPLTLAALRTFAVASGVLPQVSLEGSSIRRAFAEIHENALQKV